MKKLIVFAMVAAVLTIFNGCQKDELGIRPLAEDVKPQEVVKAELHAKNGILIFANHESVGLTLNSIAKMSEQERRFWEGKYSFVSQTSIFHDIINAELKLDEPYTNMSKEELKNMEPPAKHSEIYYKYLKMGMIEEYIDSEGIEMYDYSTCAPYLASILNEDGIFVVGDTMYLYSATSIKRWIDCDINNPQKMINTNESTDKIEVTIQLKSTTVNYGSWQYDSGNKRRIRIGINFNSYQYYADGTVWNFTHWVEVQSQKKNFWGNWKYNWTTMYVKGHWDYSITYGNEYYPEDIFQNSAGYHEYPNPDVVYASNLKSSCHISTGTIYPFNSVMSIMTDGTRDTGSFYHDDLKVIYEVELDDYFWQVTGHSYVTAYVYN